MLRTVVGVLCLSIGVLGCAPAPPAIPPGAARHWDLKSSFYWTWTQPLERGCVSWMAKEEWVSVQLVFDPRCERFRELEYLTEPGIHYLASSDLVVFQRYWPQNDRYVGDECPHSISETQIAEVRVLAAEAIRQSVTAGERRVLRRIDERLSVADGNALTSDQFGCSDLPREARGTRYAGEDAWQDGR
jgi:hypothetical protein